MLGIAVFSAAMLFSLSKGAEPIESDPVQSAAITEVTPVTGFMGASPSVGVKASMGYSGVALELAGDAAVGNTAALYMVMANAIINLSETKRAIPYGILGGGLFLTVPAGAVGSRSISNTGICYGAGLRYYFTKKYGLRIESKQFLTQILNAADNRQELFIFQSISLGVLFGFH